MFLKNMFNQTMNLVTHDENHSSDKTVTDPIPLCVNYVTHGSHHSNDILTIKPETQNEKHKSNNAIIHSNLFPSNNNYVTHGDTDIFTNVVTPFTNSVKYGEKPQSNNVIIDNEPFFPGINCGTHSDICINVPTPVTNPLLNGKNLQSNNVNVDNDLFCSNVNYVPHSYNNPFDFCINACTTDRML